MRNRLVYLALIALVIPLGLLTRSNPELFPDFIARYSGDALWALTAFLGLAVLLPRAKTRTLALLALAFAYSIEFSQLYQAQWINAIRDTTPGALVLGEGFVWIDFVFYAVGIFAGVSADIMLSRFFTKIS